MSAASMSSVPLPHMGSTHNTSAGKSDRATSKNSTVQYSNCGRGSQTSALASEPRTHEGAHRALRPVTQSHDQKASCPPADTALPTDWKSPSDEGYSHLGSSGIIAKFPTMVMLIRATALRGVQPVSQQRQNKDGRQIHGKPPHLT
jgi:hypothetical protein